MSFTLPPFFQNFVQQAPKATMSASVLPRKTAEQPYTATGASEPSRFQVANFQALPTVIAPKQVGSPKGDLGYRAPGTGFSMMA